MSSAVETNSTNSKILWAILVCAAFSDMLGGTFFDAIPHESAVDQLRVTVLFLITSTIILGIGQYQLLSSVRQLSIQVRGRFSSFKAMFKLLVYSQFILVALFAWLVYQMLSGSQYSQVLAIAITAIGTMPGGMMLILLCLKFFGWYRHGYVQAASESPNPSAGAKDNSRLKSGEKYSKPDARRNAIVLLLGLSALTGSAGAIIGNIAIIERMWQEHSPTINPDTSSSGSGANYSVNILFYTMALFPLVISFYFQWGGIALIMKQFSQRGFASRLRFSGLVLSPLILFTLGIAPSLMASPESKFAFYSSNVLVFRLLATIGAAAGYFVMGIGYLLVARSLRKTSPQEGLSPSREHVANYLMTSGIGVMLISIAFQSPAVNSTYPPLGLIAHSFLGFSAFVFSLGFYSSAISVSENITLRKELRSAALDKSRFVNAIGDAEMTDEIRKQVLAIAKKKADELVQDSAVEPAITADEMNSYVDEVVKELQKNAR